MAMFHDYRMGRGDIKAAFDRAAGSESRYLLLLSETANDEWNITVWDATRTIADQSEIVPLLRESNKSFLDVRLENILDLSGDFNRQIARPGRENLQAILSPQTQQELAAFGQECELKRAQREWDRKPWLERLFSSRP